MIRCGERKPDDVWFPSPLFLDGEQKKKERGDRKPRGKRGTEQLETGDRQQVFTDLTA